MRCFAILLLISLQLAAQVVEVRNGNIYSKDEDGKEKQLTATGLDSDASLSPDGMDVVFLRRDPPKQSGNDVEVAPRILIADLSAASVRELFAGPVNVDGRKDFGIMGPQLAPDKQHLYFLLGDYAATTGAVIELALSTRQTRFVAFGLSCTVVPKGMYGGDLLIEQRRRKLGGGYYYWVYLFTPSGKELGVVGDDKQDVSNFFLTYVAPF